MKYEINKFDEVTFDVDRRRDICRLETAIYDGRDLEYEELQEINRHLADMVLELYEERVRIWETV